ncbi:uroporphyrinogen-III synthase [Oscillatoria sp. FACHB-1407]|uniref:uroporphyrinogen-III synthase n=1 Tax=Oscillatoria sp. FACHB-1407 TaxID=2692847 RepID=UPI001683BD49|nr:uroporphyrinogen-III synthase [Oscillatoria sp. FACHB-1407]
MNSSPLPTPHSPLPSDTEPVKPLTDQTVLVTRSLSQSSQFTQLLIQQGATVIEMPALEIGAPSSWAALDEAIAHLSQFDWLVLTSTNGVDSFFARLALNHAAEAALTGVKIAVVGQKTAARLRQHGREPDFIPPDFVADSLVEAFPEGDRLSGLKLLFPRVETGGREVLVQEFTAKGAIVTEVAAYQSCCAQTISAEVLHALQQNKVDVVTFASSKTVQCFWQLIQQDIGLVPPGVCIASIGPQTSVACRQWLGRVDVEAEEYTLEGLTQAIARWAAITHGL